MHKRQLRREIIELYCTTELTIRQIADELDISKSAVHYWLTREKDPTIRAMIDDKASYNFNTKHFTGGEATRQKHLLKKDIYDIIKNAG